MSRVSLLDAPQPLLDRLAEAVKQRAERKLRAVLACTFTFNSDWFETVLEHVLADIPRSGVPIDVVCDELHYRGHGRGYNVTRWPRRMGLFHPKLLLVLFDDDLVWAEGSLNMTREGWQRNRELVLLHEPMSPLLPRAVGRLLSRFVHVTAAREILARTRISDLAGSLGSSEGVSIGKRFLYGLGGKRARALHVVTPFLDQGETGDALEASALATLVNGTNPDQVHLYLQALNEEGTRVQGSASIRAALTKRHVIIHPVPEKPGSLHAKLVVARFGWGGSKARLLCGSPNVTRNALFVSKRANIELGRRIDARWIDVEPVLRAIRPLKARRIDQVKFQPPPFVAEDRGCDAVERAVYVPLEGVIELTWRRPDRRSATRVSYAGTAIEDLGFTPDRRRFSRSQRFDFDRPWIDVAERRNTQRCSKVPIEVPLEEIADLGDGVVPRTPEEWLEGLGTVGGLTSGLEDSNRAGTRDVASADDARTFDLGRRVRDLAARARGAKALLLEEGLSAGRVLSRWRYIKRVWEEHDPACGRDALVNLWRAWVRLVIAQALLDVSGRIRLPGGTKAARVLLARTVATAPESVRGDVEKIVAIFSAMGRRKA